MAEENNKSIRISELADKAFREVSKKLVQDHRQTGDSLVIWRDGKVCHVPASEIVLPEEAATKTSN